MPGKLRAYIHDALINAGSTKDGRDMLEKIGFAGFEKPVTDGYLVAADLLQLTGVD
jgi:hypothetical protein